MAPPPAFKGARFTWLSNELAPYEDALKQGRGPDFMRDLVKGFFKRFPPSRFPLTVDPPEEWMKRPEWDLPAVEELVAPEIRPGQKREEHLQELDVFDALVNEQISIMTQIKNFMRRRVTSGVFGFEKGGEAWNMVMAKLAGIPIGKPGRQRTAFNVWARDKEAYIDELVEKKKQEILAKSKTEGSDPQAQRANVGQNTVGTESKGEESSEKVMSDEKQGDKAAENVVEGGTEKTAQEDAEPVRVDATTRSGKKKKSGNGEGVRDDEDVAKDKYAVSIRQAVVKEEFEKLSSAERVQWQIQAKEEHDQRKAEYLALQAAGYSTDPKERQGAIDRFPAWMLEVIEEARKITGLNISVFAGGPMPSAGGALRIIGVHAGRTMGVAGQSFGAVYQGAIESVISQIYGEFLKDCFTEEDCEAMALGTSRTTMDVLYKENDAVTVSVVPAEAKPTWASVPSKASNVRVPPQGETSERHSSVATSETAVSSTSLPGGAGAGESAVPDSSVSHTRVGPINVASSSASGSGGARERQLPAQRLLPTGGAKKLTINNPDAPSAPTTAAVPSKRKMAIAPSLVASTSKTPASSSTNPSSSSTSSLPAPPGKPPFTLGKSIVGGSQQGGARGSANDITRSLLPPKRPAAESFGAAERVSSPPMPNYRSTINVAALKKHKTRVSMHTGGLPPPLPSVLRERERKRKERDAAELAEKMEREKREVVLNSGQGSSSTARPSKTIRPRRNSIDLEVFEDSLGLHKGTASSPIDLDSPVTSRAPTPDFDVPRRHNPASRMSSPSASSVASAVSVQKRPSRVRASSPPGSSPLQLPPSSQPRIRRYSEVNPIKEEKDEVMLSLPKSNGKKRDAKGSGEGGPTRKRMRVADTESEEEITAQLESVTPSSPASGSPVKGRRTRVVMSHVQVPRGSRGGRAKSAKSSVSAPVGQSKYYGAVDTSQLDLSEYLAPLPPDAPLYMHLTMEMCSNIGDVETVDDGLVEVMRLWVDLESRAEFAERGRLTTNGRPPQVSVWIGQARRSGFVPDIRDLEEYGRQMVKWWWNCAPEWRQVEGKNELRRGRGSWEELRVSGVNGLTSVVAALGWWAGEIARLPREKPRQRQRFTEESGKLTAMLDDVLYSLRMMLGEDD